MRTSTTCPLSYHCHCRQSGEPAGRVRAAPDRGRVSLLISLATAAMEAQWNVLALYWYAPRTTGAYLTDLWPAPQLLSLHLPAWHLIVGWLLTLPFSVASCRFVHPDHGRNPCTRRRLSVASSCPARLSITVGIFLFVLALHVYVGDLTSCLNTIRSSKGHLHRRARHAHRPAHCFLGSRPGAAIAIAGPSQGARALACCSHRSA